MVVIHHLLLVINEVHKEIYQQIERDEQPMYQHQENVQVNRVLVVDEIDLIKPINENRYVFIMKVFFTNLQNNW